MTVAELVEKLKSCNQDKDVLVEGRSELKDITCVSSTYGRIEFGYAIAQNMTVIFQE